MKRVAPQTNCEILSDVQAAILDPIIGPKNMAMAWGTVSLISAPVLSLSVVTVARYISAVPSN